jgi:acetyl esterase/lipase
VSRPERAIVVVPVMWRASGRRPTRGVALVALVALLVVVTAGCGGPTLSGSETTMTYCSGPLASGTLDLFEPSPAPTSPGPVVVFLHGGAWMLGDAAIGPGTFIGDLESALVGSGWAFASVNYRLAPGSRWPAQINDAKCAVRYLRAHAAALHIDPARVAAVGASAGGQLASLLGLAGPGAGFDVGPYAGVPSTVQAVVDEFGPTDLGAASWSATPVARALTPEVFGVPSQPASPVLIGASPASYVAAGDPPFLVIQGAEDDVVAPAQSEELVQRLDAAGDQATLVLVAHAGHGLVPSGSGPLTPSIAGVAQQAANFLTDRMGR